MNLELTCLERNILEASVETEIKEWQNVDMDHVVAKTILNKIKSLTPCIECAYSKNGVIDTKNNKCKKCGRSISFVEFTELEMKNKEDTYPNKAQVNSVANRLIGELIEQPRYEFVDKKLIAEVVRDALNLMFKLKEAK